MVSMSFTRIVGVCVCVLVITLTLSKLLTKTTADTTPTLQHYLLPQHRQPPAPHTCNTTIISAYYRIKSKHSYEEYLSWMINFLSLRDCMVIFVQPDLKELILSLRPPAYPTIIIPRPLESFQMAQLLDKKGWEEQEQKDPQHTKGHTKELFWIWNEKTNMMKMVSDINPFLSSYFVWLDIGAIRHTLYNHNFLVRNIPEEKGVLLLSVENFTTEEFRVENSDFSLVDRIGGGTIGSDKETLERWYKEYYGTVRKYLQMGRFIGKDQSMMATTCLKSDMCLLVRAPPDHWFWMQEWFRGETDIKPRRLNITRTRNI